MWPRRLLDDDVVRCTRSLCSLCARSVVFVAPFLSQRLVVLLAVSLCTSSEERNDLWGERKKKMMEMMGKETWYGGPLSSTRIEEPETTLPTRGTSRKEVVCIISINQPKKKEPRLLAIT